MAISKAWRKYMTFAELDTTVQEGIVNLLHKHIAATADILKQDRCLIPMLMIPDSNQIVSLQSRDGSVDVDRAYAAVVGKLKNEAFTYALFSYSTRIGLAAGGETDALKTYIFTQNGIEVSFYTPFTVKGLFKKTINVEKSILAEIKEHIFD
ncbi:MAG: hypothetical protein IJA86_05815 [Clostridia bacterium]|nr:hypothetical protein [Clostridia bacterium]